MPSRVYLVQICNVFGDSIYVPLAAGMLRAHARSTPGLLEHFHFEPIVHERFDLDETDERIVDPGVLALSTYVWNWEFSLALARRVRARHPRVLIVVGGPQVPEDCSEVLADGVVDVAVHGEGEATFVELLDTVARHGDLAEVLGISYRAGDRAVRNAPRPRIEDLDRLPSPFTGGDFDALLDGGRRLIGLWETNRGCPFGCTFCYWGSAVNQRVREFGIARLEQELEWFSRHRIDYVLCADANFGIRRRDIDIARKVRDTKARTGAPRKFRVFSTKNATHRVLDVVEVLREGGLDQGLSLTMQSLSEVALEAIGRKNIKLSSYVELAREARRRGLVSYSDLIVGLPGETYDSFIAGLDQLLELGQHDNVHVYFCTLLVGSEMADPAYREKHGIVTARNPILQRHMRADVIDGAGITEYEDVVVGTRTMPPSEWIETNSTVVVFNVLHFQKVASSIGIYLRHAHGVPYRRFYEHVRRRSADATRFPAFARMAEYVEGYYRSVAAGRANRLVLDDFGDTVWPIEEAAFLLLSRDLDAAYAELRELVHELVVEDGLAIAGDVLDDLFAYQSSQTPRPSGPPRATVELAHDWPAWFAMVLEGASEPLIPARTRLRVIDQHGTDGSLPSYARNVAWHARSAADIPYRLERQD